MEKGLDIWWDEEGDFLEITIGKPRKGFCRELGNDMFERIDAKTGKIIGFGILNFSKHFTSKKELRIPIKVEFKR